MAGAGQPGRMTAPSAPPAPIPLAEAQGRLLAMVEPLGAETVPVETAAGRFLAADLLARRTQPPADLSAMDGYAVRADDLAGPWRVVGRSAAGYPFGAPVATGEAVRIATGALLPEGAGAVLLQEEAERDGDTLRLAPGGAPDARHIRRTGFDFRAGELLLARGARIGPPQLALAISGGHGALPVGRRPTIAVLDSGDELVADPAACADHQIPACNGAMIAAMATPLARSVTRIGPVADDPEALAAALAQADGADVLVTSGGASVGERDLVRPAIERWGATIAFWRVAMRPGKPVLVARRGRQWVIGLPGNPVSSYVTAVLFVLPLLRALAGATGAARLPLSLCAPLSAPLPATGARLEFVRAVLCADGVTPLREQDSSALASLAAANALIERPAGAAPARAGEAVRVLPLGDVGFA